MASTEYRDVLWHFSSDESTSELRDGRFLLRIFASEEELFESDRQLERTRAGTGLPVYLPGQTQLGTARYRAKKRPEQPVVRGQQMEESVQPSEASTGGRILWDALPAEATSSLQALLNDDPRPLRLKISGSSPGITDVPWEWLSDGIEPPLALRPNVRLVRSVPVRYPLPPLTVKRPLRVLLVLTNPKDERLLDSFREINAVQGRLNSPDYELDILTEPTLEGLQKELVAAPPAIVHYIGHAGLSYGEGNLILHDYGGRTFWLPAAQLARVLPSSVRLLCLSTCFTATNYQLLGLPRLANAPATLSLPTVVANQFPVQEDAVREFWYTFYDNLVASGGDVNQAVHFARTWTQSNTASADWASFTLVLRDRTGQPFRLAQEIEAVSPERIATELQAQFATQLVNELAEQLRELPTAEGEAPHGLREQLKREQARALDLHSRLASQSGG